MLPISWTLAYIVPTIGICLPLLNLISGVAKLLAVALWQTFPRYHTIIRGLSQILRGKNQINARKLSDTNLRHCRQALRRFNRVTSVLSVAFHLAVIGTILISTAMNHFPRLSAHHILALTSLGNPPMKAVLRPPLSLQDSREFVV